MYPQSFSNLIESFKGLPGIGEKTAERLAFFILDSDIENVEFFSKSLMDARNKIINCEVCNNISENKICNICSDESRNKDLLCVVEDIRSLYMFEKSGIYNGYYYVLKDLISPLNGVNPEDIGLEGLMSLINKSKFKEIIIAVKPNIEGETTSFYIKRILEDLNIKITRIASGIPIGADMEYVDLLTLERAINDRKEIN